MQIWMKKINNLSNKLVIFLFLFSLNSSYAQNIDAKLESNIKSTQYKKNYNYKSEYLLDSGDALYISFRGLSILDGSYLISEDGYIKFPEIEPLFVRGYTLKAVDEIIKKEYEKFIIDPDISIEISLYRPVNVIISGEVKSPGLYQFDYSPRYQPFSSYDPELALGINFQKQGLKDIENNEMMISPPRVFDVIKKSGGLEPYADISKIKVLRVNSVQQGGGIIKTEVNLLKLFEEGDQSQNIRIYDGDQIKIIKNKLLVKDQITRMVKLNINPNRINVFVTGNVKNVGFKNLPKGINVHQAVAAAGGKEFFSGDVELIRFKGEKVIKKKFNIDNKNKKDYPILFEGDIINIRRTTLGNTAKIIQEFSPPILSGYSIFKIFND